MSTRSIASPMFVHQPMIDLAQWEQEFGVWVENTEAEQVEPYEETQSILGQVNKYGRDKQEMKEEWRQKLAGHLKRENGWYKGALHLWHPAKEYSEKALTHFAKGASHEASKTKKSQNATGLDAFRAHVSEARFDHGHDFCRGNANGG